MEMEFTDRGRRRRLLMMIGVIMALLAGATAFYLGNQGSAGAAPAAKHQVLVAAVTIPARTVIESGQLAMREVPDDPSTALAVTDPAQVLGLVTAVTIYADQPITPNLIATTSANAQFSILKPTETISPYSPVWRAVSMMVVKDKAVGGMILPGQRVDVIASVPVQIQSEDENGDLTDKPTIDGFHSGGSAKIAWLDVEVLAKDPDTDVYVLKMNLHQAEELALASATGEAQFTLALRPDADNRQVDRTGYGVTDTRFLTLYGFPLPQLIDVNRYPLTDPEIVPEGSPTVEWPDVDPALLPSLEPGASPLPGASPEASAVPSAEPSAEPTPKK